jgi:penicillin amidase
MSSDDPNSSQTKPSADPSKADLRYQGFVRRVEDSAGADAEPEGPAEEDDALEAAPNRRASGHRLLVFGLLLALAAALAASAFFAGRHFIRIAMRENLPQLDGSLAVYGLAAPVTVARDARGVPHIRAGSMDDLVFAQGFVTAQDRLWQMDLLRRHAAGQLAAILGRSMLEHDRLQRTLQLRASADRAIAVLPADQRHWLDLYARGVNASIAAQRAHLPVEFCLLAYQPAPWTPRDSILVELVMFQDLTTGFPAKLAREALAAHLSPELIADLYPVGSWRDHYPGQPMPDVSAPQPEFNDIPLDESQSQLRRPSRPTKESGAPSIAVSSRWVGSKTPGAPSISRSLRNGWESANTISPSDLLSLNQTLALFHAPCSACVAGSNAWAVSGSRTASGKPLLSNDMHLSLSVPDLWYEADLEASNPAPLAAFHAAGVTLPGTPFIISGHNDHVAWGFTNLGADVQDLIIEHTRGTSSGAEFQTSSGAWLPVRYQTEVIQVRGSTDVILDVPLTRHGDTDTPIVSSVFPTERRSLSLRWTIYDPANLTAPFFAVDSAADWPSMLAAFAAWGGPAQNLIYADDQGHIAYHALGRIPIRGDINNPSPLSPVPTDATAPDAAAHEWVGTIPFDQLPQALDPPDGVLAAANARVTPDGYRFPITLNWMAPYRTERIYKVLESSPMEVEATDDNEPGKVSAPVPGVGTNKTLALSRPLTPLDMLTLQNDAISEPDLILAQRLAYSIDHATGPLKNDPTLHQAADILRKWNGSVDANASAPAIVNAARATLWPMLLIPKLAPEAGTQLAQGADLSKVKNLRADAARAANLWQLYTWGERDSVEEQLITHTPARWLPSGFATWDDFLAAVVLRGLRNAHAPRNLATWQQGSAFPLDIEHPIFSHATLLARLLLGVPTGTGPQSQSGDLTTVRQSGHAFGPSERFTADLSDPDRATLNLVLGQSGNPGSPLYMDQFQSWLRGTTFPLPFTPAATQPTITHTHTLTPR